MASCFMSPAFSDEAVRAGVIAFAPHDALVAAPAGPRLLLLAMGLESRVPRRPGQGRVPAGPGPAGSPVMQARARPGPALGPYNARRTSAGRRTRTVPASVHQRV